MNVRVDSSNKRPYNSGGDCDAVHLSIGRNTHAWLIVGWTTVLLAGLGLRAVYFWLTGGTDYLTWMQRAPYYDAMTPAFVEWAQVIAAGKPYPALNYPPGYALFLAIPFFVGFDGDVAITVGRALQLLIDTSGAIAIALLISRLGMGRVTALLGAGLYLFWTEFAFGGVLMLTEWMAASWVAWMLYFLSVAMDTNRVAIWLGLGAWFGLGTLFRPELLVAAIVLLAVLAVYYRARLGWTRPLGLVLGAAIVVTPWGIYNKLQHEVWVFTSTSGGIALWDGLGEIENPYGMANSDIQTGRYLEEHGYSWGSSEGDAFLKREAVEFALAHPIYMAELILNRWRQIALATDTIAVGSNSLNAAYAQVDIDDEFYLFLALSVVGAVIAWRRERKTLVLFCIPMIFAMLTVGLIHYEPRYVRYAHLSYILLTVMAVSALARISARHRWIAPATGVMLLVTTAAAQIEELTPAASLDMHLSNISPYHFEDQAILSEGARTASLTKWEGVKGISELRLVDHGIRFDSLESVQYEYIGMYQIRGHVGECVRASGHIETKNGNAMIGILSTDRSMWLVQHHEGKAFTLNGVLWPGKQVTLVVAGDNSEAQAITTVVRNLMIATWKCRN